MYRRVTQRVKDGIDRGDFDDGPRMDHFDAVFAQYYFDALDHWKNGRRPTLAWELTFQATDSSRPIVAQHLLLGMNAHIFLDLGVAAAKVAPGDRYRDLHGDFQRINAILISELDPTENRVGELSPVIRLLDSAFGTLDERLAEWWLRRLRESAWEFGGRLATATPERWPLLLAERDDVVASAGRELLPGGCGVRLAAAFTRLFEVRDVARNIRTLS